MSIEAQSADGVIHEFPDGTDNSVIDRVMKQYVQKPSTANIPQDTSVENDPWYRRAGRYVDDMGRSLANGATAGFADNFAGFMDAATQPVLGRGSQNPSFGDRLNDNLHSQQDKSVQFAEQNPLSAAGGRLVGGAALGPLLGVKAPVSMLGSVRQGALAGALYNTAQGINESTPDPSQLTGMGLLKKAGTGLIGGAAMAPVGLAIGAVGNRILSSPETQGAAIMQRAMQRDVPVKDWSKAGAKTKQLQQMGYQPLLGDIFGSNVQQATKSSGTFPGVGQQLIEETMQGRQMDTPTRLARHIVAMEPNVNNYPSVIQGFKDTRAGNAAQAYDNALAAPPLPLTPQLETILKRPSARAAYPRAATIAAEEDNPQPTLQALMKVLPPPTTTDQPDVDWTGAVRRADLTAGTGNWLDRTDLPTALAQASQKTDPVRAIDWPTLHYTQQAMNDAIGEQAQQGFKGTQQVGRIGTRKELMSILTDPAVNPEYAQATNQYKVDSHPLNMAEHGESILSQGVTPDEFGAPLAEATPEGRAAARLAAAYAMKQAVGNTNQGANAALRISGSPNEQTKAAMVFGPNWQPRMQAERGYVRATSAMNPTANSATTKNAASMAEQAPEFAVQAATEGPKAAAWNWLNRNVILRGSGWSSDNAEAVAKYATQPAGTKLIQQIAAAASRQPLSPELSALATALMGAQTGNWWLNSQSPQQGAPNAP